MNSHDAHQQRLFLQPNADANSAILPNVLQGQGLGEMEMQTIYRAGSPCRQAATEILEDISMEAGIEDESYRRDLINVFPGHPALPQQTHNLQGQPLIHGPREAGAPGATILGNYEPQNTMPVYQNAMDCENQHMMETQDNEPDWITQMLEQVQRVGLWNDPIPEEPSRVFDMPEPAAALSSTSGPSHMNDFGSMDPIPFYRANMESLLTSLSPAEKAQEAIQMMPPPPIPVQQLHRPPADSKAEVRSSTANMPSNMDSSGSFVNQFQMPIHEAGMGVIGQNQSTQSIDYLHLIRNALSVPGVPGVDAPQPLPLARNRTVSLELSNDGMKEVLASTRQNSMNDGPFRPPTKAPSRHTLASRRSMEASGARPILQQSKLQLQLGLAADAPLDLRKWGYGGGMADTPANGSLQSKGKRSLSSEGLHAVGSSAEMNQSHLFHGRPDASGCTTADSMPSAGGPSRALQSSAEYQQHSFNSGSAEHNQQISDKKSGLSADEVTRLESLERYREKKRRRLYTKTIRYHKRKVNADARKRYKGRFVKAETSGQAMSLNTKDSADQVTDPGHRGFEQSIEASDLQTV